MSILVRERMSSPPHVATSGAKLPGLVKQLEAAKISALPIVDEGRLVGIVSTTDLVKAKAAGALTPEHVAGDCMTREVVTVPEDAQLAEAARRLTQARVHRLVVVDKDARPVGVLSTRDLLRDVAELRIQAPLAQIMTPEPRTVDVGDSIRKAIEELAESNVHGLVVTEGRRPVGVFTHAEALAARALPASLREGAVETVMSYETICLDAQTPVHRAASQALAMNVRRLLVVDRRDLVGIASCLDLAGVLGRDSQR